MRPSLTVSLSSASRACAGLCLLGLVLCLVVPPDLSVSAHAATPAVVTEFHEYFDNLTRIEELFQPDFSRWTGFEIQPASTNKLELNHQYAITGTSSLKCVAAPSSVALVSKSALEKTNYSFKQGDVVMFIGWFYLVGNQPVDNVFIFDLEGPPLDVRSGGSPGIRLVLASPNGALAIERGKFGQPTIYQPDGMRLPFPRNQWVNVRFLVKLSQRQDGAVELWQNFVKIVSRDGVQTMPTDVPGIIVGTNGTYTRTQVGITANTRSGPAELLVDDFHIGLKL